MTIDSPTTHPDYADALKVANDMRPRLLAAFEATPPKTTRDARVMALRETQKICVEVGHSEWEDLVYFLYKKMMGLV